MLDLGGIPAVLEIRSGGYLELRDMLLKNIATEQDLRNSNFTSYIRPNFTRVSGMLSWPSFYAEAGASYGVYNTTQYFWSNTIFYRGDCDWQNPVTPPDSQKVNYVLSLTERPVKLVQHREGSIVHRTASASDLPTHHPGQCSCPSCVLVVSRLSHTSDVCSDAACLHGIGEHPSRSADILLLIHRIHPAGGVPSVPCAVSCARLQH